MQSLEIYLNVPDTPEDDFANQDEIKTIGSCQWFEERSSYHTWRDTNLEESRIYWLTAKPAAGKSVLAGHVITHLQSLGLDCSYYFFKFGNKGKQVLSGLLRSIAYQVALSNPGVRRLLYSMHKDNIQFDKDDERAIWRKLFAGGIFKSETQRPQYWVIDALDECVNATKFSLYSQKLKVNGQYETSSQVDRIQNFKGSSTILVRD